MQTLYIKVLVTKGKKH